MENLSGVRIADTILTARRSCYACPIACKRVVEIAGGEYAMPEGPGPEYEAVGSLGFMPRISDMHAVVKANALCNSYGLDAISTGSTIAYAIEAFRRRAHRRGPHRGYGPRLGPARPTHRAHRYDRPAGGLRGRAGGGVPGPGGEIRRRGLRHPRQGHGMSHARPPRPVVHVPGLRHQHQGGLPQPGHQPRAGDGHGRPRPRSGFRAPARSAARARRR